MAPSSTASRTAAVTAEDLESYRAAFAANPAHRLAMNACSRGDVDEIALNRQVLAGIDWHFSHEVETGAITHQKQAGFCWMYAALNWLRVDVMAKLKLESFDFSHNYMIFWDRFEKANRFLTAMVALRDRSPEDRMVDWLLREPCPDGGEWHMVANLIRKYGLAPKSAMADTFNLTDSKFLNKVVDAKLRQTAARLFATPSEDDALKIKQEAMSDVYRILCILMGEPPQRFDFAYRDKDKAHHALRDLTPHAFYEQVVGLDLDDYAWVMSSPVDSTPYHRTFYIEQFQNVVEGDPGVFVNVELPTLKELAVKALKDKQALLFGCDVLQASSRKVGVMDPEVMAYDLLFNTSFGMTRKQRMQFLQARLTHNMVILGVDLVDDRPTKWKIENSWGDEPGNKGIFLMTDAWFDEHMYALVVHRKYLDDATKAALTQQPTVLPPWHCLA
jgi:bleomycin hydrolase